MKTTTILLASALLHGLANAAPQFYLPGPVYATPGLECNVYYKNIIQSVVPQNFSYQAESKVGTGRLTRWHWTPEAKDAGTTNQLVLRAWNDDGAVACLTTQVIVAEKPKDATKRVTFALFADSLVNSGYPAMIYENMRQAGYANFTPVGSRKPRPDHKGVWAPHDGIPGYTCSQFLLHCHVTEDELLSAKGTPEYELYKHLGPPQKIANTSEYDRQWVRSPLIREENGRPVMNKDGTPVVDVQMWLDRYCGGKPPDVLLVELGLNDVFWYKGEEAELRARWRNEVLYWYQKFYDTLRAKMPKTLFAFATLPPGASQDGFGENYGSDWNEIQHRKIAFALNKEIADFVAKQNSPLIELLPLAQVVDPLYGYCHFNCPVNARTNVREVRSTNAVHVSKEGSDQVADLITAWLQAKWNTL